MIDSDLLKIMCCPETHQPIAIAEKPLIDRLNAQIPSGRILNRAGREVKEPLDGGLVREDQKFLYPVRSDIPIMLIDEAIPLETENADKAET